MFASLGNPAGSLSGVTLDNGWEIKQVVKKKPNETGGHFSVCYIVEKEERKAFLKALDLTDAFRSKDFLQKISELTTSFLFERELLYKCRDNHLSKVVVPIEHGEYLIPGQQDFLKVYYIIFEIAETNLRRQITVMKDLDLAWIFRSLHQTAIGLSQLHKSGIAHQDLKPSNVLVFRESSKISDLGRSSDKSKPSMNDEYIIPGDQTYAPFELFYGIGSTGEFKYRFASDMYHLGSLIFFYFLRTNLQQILDSYLIRNDLYKNFSKDYDSDLPYIQQSFSYALSILEKELEKFSYDLSQDLIPLVKMLCNPDYRKRGHTRNISQDINQYSLERFISRFDYIAKKAEYRIYEH